jgi:hypothetical protein
MLTGSDPSEAISQVILGFQFSLFTLQQDRQGLAYIAKAQQGDFKVGHLALQFVMRLSDRNIS